MTSEHPQRAWGRAQRRGELLQRPAGATHHAARGPAGAAPHPRHQPQGGRGAAGHLQQLERQDAAARHPARPAALGEHRGDCMDGLGRQRVPGLLRLCHQLHQELPGETAEKIGKVFSHKKVFHLRVEKIYERI